MDVTISPRMLAGSVSSIPSKSIAHRLILLAALTEGTTEIDCATTSADIAATISCVQALGATVTPTTLGFEITGIPRHEAEAAEQPVILDCGESGSTLRFLLPIVCALGRRCQLMGHGRLAARPLSPLYEQLVQHGAELSDQGSFPLDVSGIICGGTFLLPGDVSSQYVSGLLMAAPLVDGPVRVMVAEPLESAPYVALTIRALARFGVSVEVSHITIDGRPHLCYDVARAPLTSPEAIPVEGDWSNAAFWLAAGTLSTVGIEVTGLNSASVQGDRAILAALALFGARVSRTRGSAAVMHDSLHGVKINVSDIPDLVPPLAAVAAFAEGTTTITGAGRLRLKESDRLQTVSAAINALGGNATVTGDDLVIIGGSLTGGSVDAANDHRIAMMGAIIACHANGPVTILDAECVTKSYHTFWKDYAALGGSFTISD